MYTPRIPPEKNEDLLPYLDDEFLRVAQVVNNSEAGLLGVNYTIPPKLRPGLLKYFDGTEADPLGLGLEGLYSYDTQGNWNYVGYAGGDQVNADWDATEGPAEILNKPELSTVATSGSYNDLTDKPTIAGQVNSDWEATSGVEQILNKPSLSAVATSGNYEDLEGKPVLFSGEYSDLEGAPVLSTVATSGSYNDLSNLPTLFSGDYDDLIGAPDLAPVALSGAYSDLTGTPVITPQVNSDWSATSGVAQILNKPGLVTTTTQGFMSAPDKVKLDGVSAGATENSSDAFLRNRANHTGTQTLATISDAGTAALRNIGTSGTDVPSLAGANTWSAPQRITGTSAAPLEIGRTNTTGNISIGYSSTTFTKYLGFATSGILRLSDSADQSTGLDIWHAGNSLPLGTSQSSARTALGLFADVSGVITNGSGALSNDMSAFLSQGTNAQMRTQMDAMRGSVRSKGGSTVISNTEISYSTFWSTNSYALDIINGSATIGLGIPENGQGVFLYQGGASAPIYRDSGGVAGQGVYAFPLSGGFIASSFGDGRYASCSLAGNRTFNVLEGTASGIMGKVYCSTFRASSATNRTLSFTGTNVINGDEFPPVVVTDLSRVAVVYAITPDGVVIQNVTPYTVTA